MEDPFAVLGLRADAPAAAVRAAYRRLAKRLHPDVPGTGDAAAYMRVRRAYEAARLPRSVAGAVPAAAAEPGPEHVGVWAMRHAARERPGWEAAVDPEPGPRPRVRWVRLRPVALALTAAIVVGGGLHLWNRPRPAPPFPDAVPEAQTRPDGKPPGAPPEAAAVAAEAAVGEAIGEAGGDAASFYVRPGSAPATLFRYDGAARRYAADGRLEAFELVRVRRMVPDSGMAELSGSAGGQTGYVLAEALESGDAHAARTSRCVYQAGTPPVPGEILAAEPLPSAPWRLVPVDNTGDLSAVFALRDADGHAVVSVFLGPHGSVALPLTPGFYRAEYASGDLWSRACARFVAGARAARMARAAPLPQRYVLPMVGAVELVGGDFSEGP